MYTCAWYMYVHVHVCININDIVYTCIYIVLHNHVYCVYTCTCACVLCYAVYVYILHVDILTRHCILYPCLYIHVQCTCKLRQVHNHNVYMYTVSALNYMTFHFH